MMRKKTTEKRGNRITVNLDESEYALLLKELPNHGGSKSAAVSAIFRAGIAMVDYRRAVVGLVDPTAAKIMTATKGGRE